MDIVLSAKAISKTYGTVRANAEVAVDIRSGEIHAILGRYPGDAGDGAHSAFDDVMVTAATELQPMRDPVHEVWGGIGAPVWALLHPTQAWRIFLPIPPK